MESEMIRAVVFRENDWWIAQCLECDVTAAAKTLADLHPELERILIGHLILASEAGTEPFVGLSEAPTRFFELWDQAATQANPVEPADFSLPAGLSRPSLSLRLAA